MMMEFGTMRSGLIALALTIGLAGCGGQERAEEGNAASAGSADGNAAQAAPTSAVATLQSAQGAAAGTATASAAEGGIRLALNIEGLPPGPHGVHVHLTGRCDAPDFTSAGGHWNPADAQHGLEAPPGQHAGDMPNLIVTADGRATLEYTLQGGSFEGLLDADGSAMVIHAAADDQRTDPSGNSGDRIACGIFKAADEG
jgi:Cu-Zn family superoxide dismutase